MHHQRLRLLDDFLFFFYALFVFGSTFSIALAQVALGVSLLLFIVLSIARRYNPFCGTLKWFYIFVGLYIGWMLVASLMGRSPVRSVLILKEEWLFCAVPIGIYLLAKDRFRSRLVMVFAVGVGLFAFYGVLQMFTGVHWFKSVGPNPGAEFGYVIKGNFPSPMTFGNYFATATGFFIAFAVTGWQQAGRKQRLLLGLVCLMGLVATVGSYNRGAILGLVAGLILLAFLCRNRNLVIGIVSVAIVAAVIAVSFSAVRNRLVAHTFKELNPKYEGGRIFVWSNAVKIAAENPIFGVGQGNFRDEYRALLPPDVDPVRIRVHAHNDLLNIAAIAGVPGMLFFAGIWWAVFTYAGRGFRRSTVDPDSRRLWAAAIVGSTVFAISSLTEATFADEEVRQMLMFVWAVGLWPWQNAAEKRPGTESHVSSKTS